MTWLKMAPWLLAIAGSLAAYVMFNIARKRKSKIDDLADRLATITLNLQLLRDAQTSDAQSQAAVLTINQEIKEAKSDEDAERIRNEFVDTAFGGLRDMQGSDNPAG